MTTPGPAQPPRLLSTATVPQSLGFIRGLAAEVARIGLAFEVATAPGDELDRFCAEEGIRGHPLAFPRRIDPVGDVVAIAALVRLLRARRPTIVHASTPKAGLLTMIAGRLAGTPCLVYSMLGLPHETATGLGRVLLQASERLTCRLAHRVIAVGPGLRDVAVAARLVAPERVVVLANGSSRGVEADSVFDPASISADHRAALRQRLGIPADAHVVGFVGRLARDKGIADLVAAANLLRDTHPGLHVLLVGPDDDRDPVPPAVRDHIAGDARFHRVGATTDPASCYAIMDLFAFPTYREGFPNVPLEAAAMALPVVATRATGVPDAVVDGVTGLLVPVGHPPALAAAIARYLADPDLRRAHGRAGRERVLRDFRPELVWDALLALYRSELAARGIHLPPPDQQPASSSARPTAAT